MNPRSAVIAVYIYQIETAHIQHRDHDIAANGKHLELRCIRIISPDWNAHTPILPSPLRTCRLPCQVVSSQRKAVSIFNRSGDGSHVRRVVQPLYSPLHPCPSSPLHYFAEPKHEYQNIRKKAFPWGQQAIFFNPKANYPSEEM